MCLGHGLEGDLEAEVVEVGAAAAGPVVSLKVVPGKGSIGIHCFQLIQELLLINW